MYSVRLGLIGLASLLLSLGVCGCGDDNVATSTNGGPSAGTSIHDAGASPDAATPASDSEAQDPAQRCVDTINAYRASLNLPPYARWTEGEGCAASQAEQDSQSGTAHGAFGSCQESAQDECPGWPGAPGDMITQCLAQMWAEGPGDDFQKHGHYLNMSSSSYGEVACGFFESSDGVWAVQNFR